MAQENYWTKRLKDDGINLPVLSLEELRELPQAKPFDAGIYFIWDGDTLQYVGKATQIVNRMTAHLRDLRFGMQRNHPVNVIPHDRYTCLVLENTRYISNELLQKLEDYERSYLAKFSPPYNYHGQTGKT